MYKQVIVMRKDLNMRKGKMIAQGAHASMKVILDNVTTCQNGAYPIFVTRTLNLEIDSKLNQWLSGLFTKIVVSVNNEYELLSIYNKAKEAGILCSIIEDAGRTEFGGVVTRTCCAIGPDSSENIDKITGSLPLL